MRATLSQTPELSPTATPRRVVGLVLCWFLSGVALGGARLFAPANPEHLLP